MAEKAKKPPKRALVSEPLMNKKKRHILQRHIRGAEKVTIQRSFLIPESAHGIYSTVFQSFQTSPTVSILPSANQSDC